MVNSRQRLFAAEHPLFPNARSIPKEGRRAPFEVSIVREGKHWKTLGLIVSADDNPRHLIVEDIWQPSLISEWNATHDRDKQVRVGDIIVSINDCSSDSKAMLSLIQSLGEGSHVTIQ